MNILTKGERLKLLRTNSNYTLEEVGKSIGISKQTLFKYENDIITNIPSDKIENLSNFYGVSPAYIMGWEEKITESEIDTIAAHHEDEDWTEEELQEIQKFKEFVKAKRNQK